MGDKDNLNELMKNIYTKQSNQLTASSTATSSSSSSSSSNTNINAASIYSTHPSYTYNNPYTVSGSGVSTTGYTWDWNYYKTMGIYDEENIKQVSYFLSNFKNDITALLQTSFEQKIINPHVLIMTLHTMDLLEQKHYNQIMLHNTDFYALFMKHHTLGFCLRFIEKHPEYRFVYTTHPKVANEVKFKRLVNKYKLINKLT